MRFLLRVLPFDPVARVARNHAKLEATTDDVRMDGQWINAKWFRELAAPAAGRAVVVEVQAGGARAG